MKNLKEICKDYYVIPKDILFIDGIHCEQKDTEEYLSSISINEDYEIKNKTKPKKLSDEQVEKIKNDDRSYRIIAKDYNISLGTINKIKNNKY